MKNKRIILIDNKCSAMLYQILVFLSQSLRKLHCLPKKESNPIHFIALHTSLVQIEIVLFRKPKMMNCAEVLKTESYGMFVIWSSHNDNLKGHNVRNYKPAMPNRSGKILLLSNLASPIK